MVEEALSFWTEIQRFEDMLAADPRSLSFAPLAELYRKLGLLDDAIAVASKGCALHPDYAGGFFALACGYLDKGRKDEARPALERVIELNPENLRAQRLLGQIYVDAGDDARARVVLARVLVQNPDDTETALLLRSLGNSQAGAAEPDPEPPAPAPVAPATPAAPAPSPGDESALLEEVEVIEELTEVLEEPLAAGATEPPAASAAVPPEPPQAPRNPLTTATIAELYVSQGHVDKAIAIYLELLQLDPDNHPYRLRLTELKAAQERHKEEELGPAPVFASGITPLQAGAVPQEEHVEAGAPGTAAGTPPAEAHAAVAGDSAEERIPAELTRWLENIRRRRDGL